MIQVTFINRLIINCLYNCIAYNMPTFLIYYRLFLLNKTCIRRSFSSIILSKSAIFASLSSSFDFIPGMGILSKNTPTGTSRTFAIASMVFVFVVPFLTIACMLLSSFPIRDASSRIVIFFNSHNSLITRN